MTENRGTIETLGVILLALAFVLILFWVQLELLKSRSPLAIPSLQLIETADNAQLSRPIIEGAKDKLSYAPNSPAALNLLFVKLYKSGASDPEKSKTASLLLELGWRYTPAIQNLLVQAIEERNFESIVTLMDALLRQDKATDQAIALLVLFENEPKFREFLVQRLKDNPRWAHSFWTSPLLLKPNHPLNGRSETIKTLLNSGGTISREHIAPSLLVLAKAGKTEQAWDLYKLFCASSDDLCGESRNEGLLDDSEFKLLAESSSNKDYRALPFEWTAYSKVGLDVRATKLTDHAELSIRWNGRGVPTILSQYAAIRKNLRYQLRVSGFNPSVRLDKVFQFVLRCDSKVLRFVPIASRITERSRLYETEEALPCDFPIFELRGRVQDFPKTLDVDIKRMELLSRQ
tara:strand:+ start:149 stop:1360 length:1212 start_codon:yes stop_codon:yes gene_type:complete